MDGEPALILLVEDDESHAALIRRSLTRHRAAHEVRWLHDGREALDYLFRRGEYADPDTSPRPQLVLLDLRLPKIDGFEVLEQVKADESLRSIPVVVLSTSAAETDLARAAHYHANSYVVKPVDFGKLSELIGELGRYWLDWHRQPAGSAAEGVRP